MAIATEQVLPRVLTGIGDLAMSGSRLISMCTVRFPICAKGAPGQIVEPVERAGSAAMEAHRPTATKMRAVASRRKQRLTREPRCCVS
jgi:hypothetical protein